MLMADDTPTVEAVTAMLREAQAEIAALKRTLAAVRAENAAPVTKRVADQSCLDIPVDAAPSADFPEVTLRSLMREWLEEAARQPRYSALAKLLKRHAAAAKAGADALKAK